MRIFSGALATETNTFAPMPTGLASFNDRGYFPAGQHPDHMLYFSGPLWGARLRGAERGWDLVEGMVAGAQPSGITTRHAYETLRDELLRDLRAALPVDMVLLGLHGAMVADGYDDCEGDLLTRVRAIVGPDVVVGAELDPHNHLSAAMLAQANLLVCYKEYPHTDVKERALELVDLCAATVEKRIRPTLAVVDCDMVTLVHTSRNPARAFVDRIQSLEGHDGVLSISITHGFPWGDVADMGTKVFVYTDNNPAQAAALARQLADELIAMREQLSPAYPGVDAALDEAMASDGGPVVIADSADNPGGGAASDSTFLLRRMIERGIANAVLGPLWDPIAVRIAFDAGVVEEAVDATIGVERFLHIGLHRGGLGHIGLDAGAGAAPLCHHIDRRLCRRRVGIHHHDLRATQREAERRRAAYAAATAGDQRDLAGKVHVRPLP